MLRFETLVRFPSLALLLTVSLALTSTFGYGQSATSVPPLKTDGTWVETDFGKPILDRGVPGSWNAMAVDNPFIFVDGGVYYCFFEGQDKPFGQGGHEQIGLAVSPDGVHWQKLADPIIRVGDSGQWDSTVAKLPAGVIKHENRYYLFYAGRKKGVKAIGTAVADHPLGPWKKVKNNPVFTGQSGPWGQSVSTLPNVTFRRDGRFWMLYRGLSSMQGNRLPSIYRNQAVGLAVSDNLLDWRRAPETDGKPLTPTAEEIASFAVAQTPKGYIAISQPMDLKLRAYWSSDDLTHWKKGGPVRLKASGEVSTISNPFLVDGRWNIVYELDDRIYRAALSPSGHAN